MVRPPPSRVRASRVFDAPLRTMVPSRRARVSPSIVLSLIHISAPDMELAGIVRRPGSEAVHGIKTVSDVEELGHVDAAPLLSLIHI